jgi:poly(A) polymerase
MQPRFEKRVGSTPFGMVDQPRFRAAFDFMRLRADAGEIDEVLADWWQEFSMASDDVRQDMVDQVRTEQQQQRKQAPRVHRAPTKTAPTAPAAPNAADGAEAEFASEGNDAPRKRRRRRRSGAAKGEGASGGSAE